MTIRAEVVRKRAWHYLCPAVAATAGMSFDELKRFVSGSFSPSDEQLKLLARRMQMSEDA